MFGLESRRLSVLGPGCRLMPTSAEQTQGPWGRKAAQSSFCSSPRLFSSDAEKEIARKPGVNRHQKLEWNSWRAGFAHKSGLESVLLHNSLCSLKKQNSDGCRQDRCRTQGAAPTEHPQGLLGKENSCPKIIAQSFCFSLRRKREKPWRQQTGVAGALDLRTRVASY